MSSVDRIAEIREEAEQALADSLPEGIEGVTLVALATVDGELVGLMSSGPSSEIIESTDTFKRQAMAVTLRTLADMWSPPGT